MEDKKPLLIGLVVAGLFGVGATIYLKRSAPPPPAPVAAPAAPEAPAVAPPPVAEPLPTLAESDAFFRKKIQDLVSSPALADWLKTDDLVRRVAAATALVATGDSPRESLNFLAPKQKFKAVKKGGRMVIDPASYARYDAAASAVASLDAQRAAALVNQLDPLFQQACSELGAMNCSFKDGLKRAISHLLKTPALTGDEPLRAKILCYVYVDDRLEKLSKAQKHLMRMGPANQNKIQAKLRELGGALGASGL